MFLAISRLICAHLSSPTEARDENLIFESSYYVSLGKDPASGFVLITASKIRNGSALLSSMEVVKMLSTIQDLAAHRRASHRGQ